jgi:hypothetical protein
MLRRIILAPLIVNNNNNHSGNNNKNANDTHSYTQATLSLSCSHACVLAFRWLITVGHLSGFVQAKRDIATALADYGLEARQQQNPMTLCPNQTGRHGAA